MNAYTVDADGLADLESRGTPGQEHNTLTSLALLRRDASRRDSLQNGGCEGFPALLRVRVCFVGSNGQASIQPQHTLFSDLSEIAKESVSPSLCQSGGVYLTHALVFESPVYPMRLACKCSSKKGEFL